MAEHVCREVLLLGRERLDSTVQVRPHDCLRAAESVESRCAQAARPDVALLLPDPLEHELKVGGLDTALLALTGGEPTPCVTEVDLAGRRLIEDCLDQGRLDLDRLTCGFVVALDGLRDRVACGAPVEVIEPQVVGEEVRDSPLEPVELRERVVAERQQHPHSQSRLSLRARAAHVQIRSPRRGRGSTPPPGRARAVGRMQSDSVQRPRVSASDSFSRSSRRAEPN